MPTRSAGRARAGRCELSASRVAVFRCFEEHWGRGKSGQAAVAGCPCQPALGTSYHHFMAVAREELPRRVRDSSGRRRLCCCGARDRAGWLLRSKCDTSAHLTVLPCERPMRWQLYTKCILQQEERAGRLQMCVWSDVVRHALPAACRGRAQRRVLAHGGRRGTPLCGVWRCAFARRGAAAFSPPGCLCPLLACAPGAAAWHWQKECGSSVGLFIVCVCVLC